MSGSDGATTARLFGAHDIDALLLDSLLSTLFDAVCEGRQHGVNPLHIRDVAADTLEALAAARGLRMALAMQSDRDRRRTAQVVAALALEGGGDAQYVSRLHKLGAAFVGGGVR